MDAPQQLPTDRTIRQCLLQFGHARVGDLGAEEVELLQTGESLKMHQSPVGDPGVAEVERLQTGQFL